MRKEIFMCDFCKKELTYDDLCDFLSLDEKRYEICEDCYNNAQIIRKEYLKKYKDLEQEYLKEINKLIINI